MSTQDFEPEVSESKVTSQDKILAYMHSSNGSLPYYRVSDLIEATGLTRPTVQKALNELVALGKVKKSAFKQRVGHVYTPVALDQFGVFINDEAYDLEKLLEYIRTSESPHRLVANEQWRNFMKIFMCLVLQSEEDVPYKLGDIVKTLFLLRNQTVELNRLISTMLQELTDETVQMSLERSLESLKSSGSKFSAVNYIHDVMGFGKKVA